MLGLRAVRGQPRVRRRERRQDLRHDRIIDHLRCRATCGGDRLDLALVDFLDRLIQQLADKTDGPQANRDDASQNARPKNGNQQQRPDKRIDRARSHNDKKCDGSFAKPIEVFCFALESSRVDEK